MVISIVMRKTAVQDRAQWEAKLAEAMPQIRRLLEAEPGFLSAQYLWGAEGEGEMAQLTSWQTLEDCHRYVREGGAATVAAYEDRAVPTAAHPDGAWVRRTFEVVEA